MYAELMMLILFPRVLFSEFHETIFRKNNFSVFCKSAKTKKMVKLLRVELIRGTELLDQTFYSTIILNTADINKPKPNTFRNPRMFTDLYHRWRKVQINQSSKEWGASTVSTPVPKNCLLFHPLSGCSPVTPRQKHTCLTTAATGPKQLVLTNSENHWTSQIFKNGF